MGWWRGEDDSVNRFAARFEEDGDRILFRQNVKSAPVLVSAQDRDEAVAWYRLASRYLMLGGVVVMIAAVVGLAFLTGFDQPESHATQFWFLVIIWACLFGAVFLYIWNEPARRFAGRTPVGKTPTRAEARRASFARMTWSQFAVIPVLALLIAVPKHGEMTGGPWFIARMVFAALLILTGAIQAFRKWRSERE
ncbi:hypothetical protein [Sphingomonas immobilis]|uniref:Uncharacterized protein n=1 Tax=Sphingomonas immobilis TaxID=3063997 RepID=A0ABT9A567_9SPHN|nr:hypothetical protein [Sphingomonas sp. CA1-15]MDO7844370.1 hypothetical protein [Sphingomonas sp. CA1-15]